MNTCLNCGDRFSCFKLGKATEFCCDYCEDEYIILNGDPEAEAPQGVIYAYIIEPELEEARQMPARCDKPYRFIGGPVDGQSLVVGYESQGCDVPVWPGTGKAYDQARYERQVLDSGETVYAYRDTR